MHGADAAGVLVDPGNRIGADLKTRADVKLKHDIFAGIGGEHFDGTLRVEYFEFRLVIVISRAHSQRLQVFISLVETLSYGLPAIQALDVSRAGHDDELASNGLVQLDGAWKVLGGQGF